ncbi:S-layer homology domain-containing protein [Paenibacillus sp. HWE-109]|uniref:immunoglobulin-like domain-containing protein n=1 Tax=Paenibacillus sp. HWE-109 TaxID=1306526 RepID=UPI001EDDF56A|nr:immunoglobulin-like domain-containing protein [Paenibacillus sp. HWE-109]UKS30945.1 S-layer homology domain-containing protein [Paenibacillus sp. HWE-109]
MMSFKKLKRFIVCSTLGAVLIGQSIPLTGVYATAGDKVFDILQIPDLHGTLVDNDNNYPIVSVMARNIEEIKSQNPARSLVLGGGDNYRGTNVSEYSQGTSVMKMFNAMGVEASALGNHEFDWGLDKVTQNVPATYPLLAANLYYKDNDADENNDQRVLDAYKVFTKDGVKIAVIGAVTTDTQYALPGTVDAYKFKDIAAEVNKAAVDARAEGAQIVLANIHEEQNDDVSGPIIDVMNQLVGVDAVLGAHAHRNLKTMINGIPLIIGRDRGKDLVQMRITLAANGALSFDYNSLALDTESTSFPYGYKAKKPVVSTSMQQIVEDTFNTYLDHSTISHFTFNENSGTTAGNSAAGGLNASLVGGAAWKSGLNAGAVDLDGTDDYVSLPVGVPLNTNELTVATWVKIDQRKQWARIFDFGNGEAGNKNSFALTLDNEGYYLFYNDNGSQNGDHISDIPTGIWTHVAVVFSGTTATIYIDGKYKKSINVNNPLSHLGATVNNYLGKPQAGNDPYFDGQLDDFRIYARTLNAGEVQALVQAQDAGFVEIEKNALSLGDVSQLTRNLTLPLTGASGTTLTWATDRSSVVEKDGTVHRPAAGTGSATATLTATITKRNMTVSKPFTVTVKEKEANVGKWLTGEFHVHTFESDDAQSSLESVLDTAFTKYGLDWMATANHLRSSKRDDEGVDVPGGPIPFSQGAINYEVPKVNSLQNAGKYPNKTIFSGFEWDIPKHDHAAIGILTDNPGSNQALKAANQFEYLFTDRAENLFNPDDIATWKTQNSKITNFDHQDSLKALQWLQTNYGKNSNNDTKSYFIVTHPSRGAGKTTAAALRDFNNAAPDINFGFEGMIGSQMEPDRGGYNTTYNTSDPTADDKYKNRSFGGSDYMIAKVGGVWDSLLGEGRNYWNFANSDYHFKIINPYSSGYWPGEYSKNYTWTNGNDMQAILNGMRSGKSFSVYGDLIQALDFNIEGSNGKLEMGAKNPLVSVKEGDPLKLTIRFKSPTKNNYEIPVDKGISANMAPVVDHVDLIAGDVTGLAAPGTPAYEKDTNDSTKVIATFTSKDWTTDSDGYNVIHYDLGAAKNNQYFRLRGTNLGMNVPGETDAQGNPLLDPKTDDGDNTTRFNNINDRNYKDLWFYSNPIYVNPIAYTNQQAVTDTINKLTLGALDHVTDDIVLPTAGEHGATVVWKSSQPSVIGNDGKLVRPNNNTIVVLTATIQRGDVSQTKLFTATVKGANPATIELQGSLIANGQPYVQDSWTNQPVTVSVYASVYAPSTSSTIELSLDGDNELSYKPYESNKLLTIAEQGVHELIFRGIDNLNNKVSLSLTVKIDKVIPVITLIGESSIRLRRGSTYTEQGASATDNIGLAGKVIVTGTVDTNSINTYTLHYNVMDVAGNSAKELVRTVEVYEESDSTPSDPPVPNPTPTPTTPVVKESVQSVQMDVKAGSGTEGNIKDVVKFKVPAAALSADGQLKVTVLAADQTPAAGNLQVLSPVTEFTNTSGHTFSKAIEITFNYKSNANGKPAAVYYYNELQKKWIFIGGTPNKDGTISANVNHFTKFAVFAYEPVLFTDLVGHWATTYTNRLIGMKAIQGYENQTFHPEETVTRAQFASLLVKALGLPASAGTFNFADQSDIPAWAKADIAAAVQADLISGYDQDGKTLFKANQTITRAEMSVIMAQALKSSGSAAVSGLKPFADASDIPGWAASAVKAASAAGIVNGYEDNTFRASKSATRAEAAAMIYKLLEALHI